KPNVPISGPASGAGAASATGAAGAATTSGGGAVVQPPRIVPASKKTVKRFILCSPPTLSRRRFGANPLTGATLPPFAANPPAPTYQRHDIANERHAKPDQEQACDHRGGGIGQEPLHPDGDAFPAQAG